MNAAVRATVAGTLIATALFVGPDVSRMVFSRTISAQEAAPTRGLVRKGKVPVSEEILKFKLPRPAETTLSNGLRLIVLEDRRLPQISFQLIVPGAGGYLDPPDQPGLAAFTASLMREGTPTRTSNQISEQLELMAAALNFTAGNSPEATITGSALSDQAVRLMDLASDVLLHPSFPDEELARFKQRTRASLAQQRANPAFLAAELFSRAVYGSHPAARISPTLESLDRLTREDLVAFHRGHYLPDRAVLAVAGDVSMFQARIVVESKLGGWTRPPVSVTTPVPEPEPVNESKIYFVARPSSVQTNLLVGAQAIERTNADYDVLAVMNKIIGGGPMGDCSSICASGRGRSAPAPSQTCGRGRHFGSSRSRARPSSSGPAGPGRGPTARLRAEAPPGRPAAGRRVACGRAATYRRGSANAGR